MAWMIPENKLDSQQREFMERVDVSQQNVWIKGFAGSGKSVLLARAVKKIRNKNDNAKIVVVVFTHSLIEMFKAAFAEIGEKMEVMTYYRFMKSQERYDYILCDEVQDLPAKVLLKMKARSSHIIVAGDSNQSIYDIDPKYKEKTVEQSEIKGLISASEFELNIIHRLSRSIINAVQSLLPRMNIFNSKRDISKADTQIRLCESVNPSEEIEFVMKSAIKTARERYSVVILLPTHNHIVSFIRMVLNINKKQAWIEVKNKYGNPDYNMLNKYLLENGISLQYVGNGYGKFSESDKRVTIMTYHSSKGLDFERVYMPFVNSSLFIASNETISKTLFMVAMTRSRGELYITYTGFPNRYLDCFQKQCSHIDIHERLSKIPLPSATLSTNLNQDKQTDKSSNIFGI